MGKRLGGLRTYKKDTEDVDTDSEDHAYDSTSYFLMSRPVPGDPIEGLPNPYVDRHPGLTEKGRRLEPWEEQYADPEPVAEVPLKGWI